ncbi:ABC transporter permease [Botrimarina hoheduenensis]|uniref:ABC-2 family transporter protein n=1 Tax=Botrimarina hoheduenensis TaxID=2528000 RepID=A0A5C5VXS8_9BACT|nr:ABC-2 family transporter protein [Botrimarina hoheduenensis]TWT43244.1 hypothetical protein Pla111_21940 [Botrimarina hoheduenensis]
MSQNAAPPPPHSLLDYVRLFFMFAQNSLIRDMTFRSNFLIELVTGSVWVFMNLGFYLLIYQFTDAIAGWGQYQFFVFIATTILVNSMVQVFFMPNMQELSELVRTGGLDFALLKPIDTQFLLSLRKINWSSAGNFIVALGLLVVSLGQLPGQPTLLGACLYPLYLIAGVLLLYSVMMTLAATSIWLGRNQSLYDFWFYITSFSRYPMEIYGGSTLGDGLRLAFTYLIPILVVINVPAQLMAKPLDADSAYLAGYALLATVAGLTFSRWLFKRALESYRSASS